MGINSGAVCWLATAVALLGASEAWVSPMSSRALRTRPATGSAVVPAGAVRARMGLGSLLRRRKSAAAPGGPFDFIIVGGGTAGCVLANRLSALGDARVLVLEAGTASHKDLLVRVPVGILKTFKTEHDWDYASAPQPALQGREVYVCRGKGLGGSSCMNVMLYTRGAREDYDAWADECGDPSWRADEILPYFKRSEDCLSEENSGVGQWHGAGGPLSISDVPYQNPLSKAFLQAATEQGGPRNDDFNDWSRPQEGFGRFQVFQRRGRRVEAASTYLDPVRTRPNLEVVTGAYFSRLRFGEPGADGQPRATGVEYRDEEGNTHTVDVTSNGEVLLALGSIGSPQALMLSGVGPKDHLKDVGVPVVADVPGVGANLQDHPAVLVSHNAEGNKAAKGVSHSSRLRVPGTTKTNPVALAQWLLKGTGPLTSPGCDHGGFVTTEAAADPSVPDVQFRFLATKTISPDGMSTIAEKYRSVRKHPDGYTVQAIAARPFSRGSVRLRSKDPLDKAVVDLSYAVDKRDMASLVAGLRRAREILKQPAFDTYRGVEEHPGPAVQTDAELEEYVRRTVHSANAVVGTCKMGKASDPLAVVDAELCVRGISGVRVVDSSVMPKLPGGQTASSTVAIAEKAADIIQRSLTPTRMNDPSLVSA